MLRPHILIEFSQGNRSDLEDDHQQDDERGE